MKNNILVPVTLLLMAKLLPSCDSKNNDTEQNQTGYSTSEMNRSDSIKAVQLKAKTAMAQVLNNTDVKMNEKMMTGDFDCDFADIMTTHHQEAIDISEIEILRGNDTELKSIAQTILDSQKNDITELGQFVENYRIIDPEKQKYDPHYELTETMKMMVKKMNSLKMTGNSDNDFVALMIPHHQSGLEMAKDEISHGKNSKIKKIAQNIVEVQSKELNAFKSWKSSFSYSLAK